MSESEKHQGTISQIVVAVAVALLAGTTAPWWWDRLFKAEQQIPPIQNPASAPLPPASVNVPPSIDPTQGAPEDLSQLSKEVKPLGNCAVRIRHSLVTLRGEPSHFAMDMGRLKPGRYSVFRSAVVNFAGIQKQGWYEVEVAGRKGWIQNDGWAIDERIGQCD